MSVKQLCSGTSLENVGDPPAESGSPHLADYQTDNGSGDCTCVTNSITRCPGCQDADDSCVSSQFVGKSRQPCSSGDEQRHNTGEHADAEHARQRWSDGQVAEGACDLTGNEQRHADLTPGLSGIHADRWHAPASADRGKVLEEEGPGGQSTRQLVSGYTRKEAVIGGRGHKSGGDSQLCCLPVKSWSSVDSRTGTGSDMVTSGASETPAVAAKALPAMVVTDINRGREQSELCPTPGEGIPWTCVSDGQAGLENQACGKSDAETEQGTQGNTEIWGAPLTAEEDHCASQLCTLDFEWPGQWDILSMFCPSGWPGVAAITAAPVREGGAGCRGMAMWETGVELEEQRKVLTCTIDDIFGVPHYCRAAEDTQGQEQESTAVSEATGRRTPCVSDNELLEGEGAADTKGSAHRSEPPDCETICSGREEVSKVSNIVMPHIPHEQEVAVSLDAMLGGNRGPGVHLQNDLQAVDELSCGPVDTLANKAQNGYEVQTEGSGQDLQGRGSLPVVHRGHASCCTAIEEEPSEPSLFGGPPSVLTFDPREKVIDCDRTLSQELSSMTILTADRLMLSNESCVAYVTLDLDPPDVSGYNSSFFLVDVYSQMSLGHVGVEWTDVPHEGEQGEAADVPEMPSACNVSQGWEPVELSVSHSLADTAPMALVSGVMKQEDGKSPYECATLTESEKKEGGHVAVPKSMETVEKTTRDKRRMNCSQTGTTYRDSFGVVKESAPTPSHYKDDLLCGSRGFCHAYGPVASSLVDCPMGRRDKALSPVTHKRPYSALEREQRHTVEPASAVLKDIWAERDGDRGLKLQCLLGHIKDNCSITWSKDGAPLAEEDKSTGDCRQVCLSIANVSAKDLGTYVCFLSGPHSQVSSEYRLSPEVLSKLIPLNCPEATEDIREDVRCAPLLFREDFLCEQYFGQNEEASIVTEGVHFGEGMHRRAFRTRLLGGMVTAFKPGQPCVLKVHNSLSYGTRNSEEMISRNYSLAAEECFVQNTARQYIRAYRDVASFSEAFGEVPDIIPIYLVHRPSNNIPYATLEEELVGDFVKYSVRDGREVSLLRRESEAGQKCCAFQHWVYHETGGNLLVTDMQGVGMKLTDVGIATCRKGYRGFRGNCAATFIDQFKALHQCNQFCSLLGLRSLQSSPPKPTRTGTDPNSKPKKKTVAPSSKTKS